MTAIPEIDVLLAVYGMLSPFDSTDGVVNCNSLFSIYLGIHCLGFSLYI